MRSATKCFSCFIFFASVHSQLISPCPRLFRYEEPKEAEKGRWDGVVTLLSDAELLGVWLVLIFDKPSTQLGNWFGEVTTADNNEYLIKNHKHKLLANEPFDLKFFIKYNPDEAPPRLSRFRLNGKTVCPENGVTTEAPVTVSSILSTTSNNNNNNNGSSDALSLETGVHGDDAACGTVIRPPGPSIPGDTHEGEFPWFAAFYNQRDISNLSGNCEGSLISRYHVITVAHCVTKRKSEEPLDPTSLIIYLGKHYLRSFSNAGLQERHVERITVHPKYKTDDFSYDIAIVKLDSPVEITSYVRPVCLWNEDVRLGPVVNKIGNVVGWSYEFGRIAEQLTKSSMPIVSQETCIYSFPDFYAKFTSARTYCAGFRNSTVCNYGGSGAGMVFPRSNSKPHNPVWQLRGLVSTSVALRYQRVCDSSHFIVFTDVAQYLDWIRASLN